MEYSFIIISAIVIITCVYFIISPFFVKEVAVDNVNSSSEEKTIETIYAAVNELEMDYLMKKISEKDFHNMKSKYETIAAKILSEEREVTKHGKQKENYVDEIDKQLLKELEDLRRSRERGN